MNVDFHGVGVEMGRSEVTTKRPRRGTRRRRMRSGAVLGGWMVGLGGPET